MSLLSKQINFKIKLINFINLLQKKKKRKKENTCNVKNEKLKTTCITVFLFSWNIMKHLKHEMFLFNIIHDIELKNISY